MRNLKNKFLLLCLFTFISCVSPSNRIIQEKESPDGEKVAVVYEIGGATVSANRHISILESKKKINGKGNIFILKGTKCDVSWNSNSELMISYTGNVYYRKEELKGVQVIYYEEK